MNEDDIYTHRACERCHAQKLRCRPQTEGKCIRCTKANVECVARPQLRMRRTENPPKRRCGNDNKSPSSVSPELSKHIEVGDDGAKDLDEGADTCQTPTSLMGWFPETDFSNLGFLNTGPDSNADTELASSYQTFSDAFISNDAGHFAFDSVDYSSMLQNSKESFPSSNSNEAAVEAIPTSASKESPAFCKVDWVEDLTRLNSRVTKHDEFMTAGMEIYASRTNGTSESPSDLNEGRHLAHKESILLDETLTLTTDLIKLLDRLASRTSGSHQNGIETVDGLQPPFQKISIDRFRKHPDSITPTNEEKQKQSPIHGDQFTTLLVMSCYTRILSMYENFFTHIKPIIGDFTSTANSSQARIHLPAIIVGSFSLHSSPGLETLLIIELVTFLIGHIGYTIEMTIPTNVATTRDAFHQSGNSAKSSSAMIDVISSTHNAVRERERELMEIMGHIRRILMYS